MGRIRGCPLPAAPAIAAANAGNPAANIGFHERSQFQLEDRIRVQMEHPVFQPAGISPDIRRGEVPIGAFIPVPIRRAAIPINIPITFTRSTGAASACPAKAATAECAADWSREGCERVDARRQNIIAARASHSAAARATPAAAAATATRSAPARSSLRTCLATPGDIEIECMALIHLISQAGSEDAVNGSGIGLGILIHEAKFFR
jgi:hypothetical protein